MGNSATSENYYNLDDELNAKFDKLFGANSTKPITTAETTSALVKIVKQKRKQYTISSFLSFNGEAPDINANVQFLDIKSLIPIEKKQNRGKHFQITDVPGNKTLVYGVYIYVDSSTDSKYYTLELLDTTEKISADGNTTRTFYIDDPQEDGNRLVIFTMCNDAVLIFDGILLGDEVRISKEPEYFPYNRPFNKTARRIINESCCDISNLSNSEILSIESEDCSHEREAKIDSDIVIIDTVTQDPVLRTPYFDMETHEWRAKIRLFPYRSYFASRLQSTDAADGIHIPLSKSAVGKYLILGTKGYHKNIEQGISYLAEDGSPNSLYVIAQAFWDEKSIFDETIAIEYLNASARQGCLDAIVELWALAIVQNGDFQELLILLDNIADNESGIFLFIKAAMNECLQLESSNTIIQLYYASALEGFKPAQYRFGYYTSHFGEAWKQYVSFTQASEYYNHSKTVDNGDFQYCLGAIFLYGIGITATPRTETAGIFLMKKAIEKGNVNAIYELWDYYSNCKPDLIIDFLSQYAEPLIAITDNVDKLIRMSNDLFDIEPNIDVCDQVALIALEKAFSIDNANRTIINNLGWAYMNGRGCEYDYPHAILLLTQSAALGSMHSYFHLGRIYENGLGMDSPQIEQAIKYYQEAANMGHQKSIDKLVELKKQPATDNIDPSKQIIFNQQRLQAMITDVQKSEEEIKKTVEDTNVKVSSLINFVETDLQAWIAEQRPGVDDDELIEQFAQKAAKYINSHVQSSNQKVQDEEQYLHSIFDATDATWDRLLPATQSSLVSARVLWKLCADISEKSFDYSGIIIAATSALESELKRVFYTGFREYLLNTFGNPESLPVDQVFALWPEKYLSISKEDYDELVSIGKHPVVKLAKDDNFTMGSLPFMFDDKDDNQRNILRKRMKEYLATIFKEEYCENPLVSINRLIRKNGKTIRDPNSFVSQCEDIRTHYRNPAGHVNVLPRESAEECYAKVVGVGKVDAFRFTHEVEGLIMMLYGYLK